MQINETQGISTGLLKISLTLSNIISDLFLAYYPHTGTSVINFRYSSDVSLKNCMTASVLSVTPRISFSTFDVFLTWYLVSAERFGIIILFLFIKFLFLKFYLYICKNYMSMAYILVNLPKNRSYNNSPSDEFIVNTFDNTEELFFTFLKNNFEYDCPETYNIPKYNSIRIEQLPDNSGLYAVKEDEDLRNKLFRKNPVNFNSDGSTHVFVFKNIWTVYSALENTKITTGYQENALQYPYMPVCTDIIVTESSIDNNTIHCYIS